MQRLVLGNAHLCSQYHVLLLQRKLKEREGRKEGEGRKRGGRRKEGSEKRRGVRKRDKRITNLTP